MEEALMKKGWGAARGVAVGGGALGVGFRGVGGGAVADDSEASGASAVSEEIFCILLGDAESRTVLLPERLRGESRLVLESFTTDLSTSSMLLNARVSERETCAL
jgi:hypothetical protein